MSKRFHVERLVPNIDWCTHKVVDAKHHDHVVCISSDYLCDMVMDMMNTAIEARENNDIKQEVTLLEKRIAEMREDTEEEAG